MPRTRKNRETRDVARAIKRLITRVGKVADNARSNEVVNALLEAGLQLENALDHCKGEPGQGVLATPAKFQTDSPNGPFSYQNMPGGPVVDRGQQ